MREIFLAPSDSTDTSLVLRAEDGEEFFLEVTDELRELLAPADSADSTEPASENEGAEQDAESTDEEASDSSPASAQQDHSTGLRTVMPASGGSPSSPQSQPAPQAQEIRLRPNEIQARIRAGASAAEIAEELEVPESRIEPFAHPVLLERARIADVAKQAHPIREDGPAKLTLWEILATAFAARGHSLSEATWDAYRHQGEPWILRITWKTGLSANEAEWTFKQTMSSPATVEARNSVAADLTDPDFVQPVRSLTSVGRGERYDEAIDGREYAEGREVNEAARAGTPGVTELSSYTGGDDANNEADAGAYAEPSVLPSPHGGEHPAESAADADTASSNEEATQQTDEKDTGVDEDFLQNPDPEPKPTKRRRKAVTPHWEDVLLGVRSSTKRPRE
ncbi:MULTISPECIES: septation protein SepH [unclassified Corynebacterium]|uniref:septation protein SepH n=1 Tax=unclassified Corynebacterium TaxID=2624378 RepID=UPI0008A1DB61|nr:MULTISPECIES: septation protein SepH [unclassified Corynebacterium]OFK69158.1 DNA-binding protein [Corynebacterium sp. HMSC074A09]OHO52927.1 DNA-binding protein [Corynebacterium sp. HMSC035E02]